MPDNAEEKLVPVVDYVAYRECTSQWHVERKQYPRWSFCYILKGMGKFILNGVHYEGKQGNILCVPKNYMREAWTFPDQLMRCYSVEFDLQDLQGREAELPFPIMNNIGICKDLIYFFEELAYVWTESQPGYALKSRGITSLIIHRLFELLVYQSNIKVMDTRIKKVTRYIMKHYAEEITIKKMAAQVNLNEVYFGNLFKRELGLCLHEYLMRIRIKNAENMLRSGEYKVMQVAELCGYPDVFYFDRLFKKVTGKPPSSCIPKYTN
jgi:AraC-like DNA-binding protein